MHLNLPIKKQSAKRIRTEHKNTSRDQTLELDFEFFTEIKLNEKASNLWRTKATKMKEAN